MTNTRKILVTGAFGQIGSELVPALQEKYGKENVIAMDINTPTNFDGIAENFNILDQEKLTLSVETHNVGTIYHLVSLLSAKGEENPSVTWNINMEGLKNVLDLSVKNKIKVFWPSSIAAFGPTTPRLNTPQSTLLEPTSMYGVTKVAGELMCRYYHLKSGLDVRSLRYPGLISWKAEPGGGTTDYAVGIFYDAIKTGKYNCFVKEDTMLPMMYMDDAVRGTIQLMEMDPDHLEVFKPYNFAAMSFTVKELSAEINKHLPVSVTYEPDHRQKIADSWPKSIDDTDARRDWGWQPKINLAKMTEIMLEKLQEKLK